MRLFSNKDKVVKADIHSEIPIPKPYELLAVPVDNTLWHPKIAVYENRKQTPEWYKNVTGGTSGLRRCYGLGDYMKMGYTVPLWAKVDVRIPLSKLDNRWDAQYDIVDSNLFDLEVLDNDMLKDMLSKEALMGNQFPAEQAGECPVHNVKTRKNSAYLKLTNPWLFKTAPGYSTLFIQPQWDPNENYSVMSGIVNTDYYHHCNVVLNITGTSEFSIEEGTPLFHAIPFKRSDLIKNSRLIKGDEGMHKLLDIIGFDNVHRSKDWEGAYKHEQNKVDKGLNT
jgi:hypothetical protein